MSDTFARSCDHWSEAGRMEMANFYALAAVDYRHLAEARDWKQWLIARQRDAGTHALKLLDVACGSGKFPSALCHYADVAHADVHPIDYALLDPAAFSIQEARAALSPPFVAGNEFETTLQDLPATAGTFDIVWATHALYAIPAAELEAALTRFVAALKVGTGHGFIAHANEAAHYIRFYRHYLDGFKGGDGVPYATGEEIIATLEKLQVKIEVQDISYENGAPDAERAQVEGYLQRCLFDDTLTLDDMQANAETGPYLATCLQDEVWRFRQHVSLISLTA